MTPDPLYCPAQTYRGSRLEPSEYCEELVESDGDFCPAHEEEDRSDDEYERYREDARYDRES